MEPRFPLCTCCSYDITHHQVSRENQVCLDYQVRRESLARLQVEEAKEIQAYLAYLVGRERVAVQAFQAYQDRRERMDWQGVVNQVIEGPLVPEETMACLELQVGLDLKVLMEFQAFQDRRETRYLELCILYFMKYFTAQNVMFCHR